ncbi:prepilin-type N-terminal cleavage/methylation domain-containing protein [uncultured Tolumonas sp.]|uniref:prepilin-type N-terminal cleavage/methylation domain-containing protein n=1 Tax=uncultured Tolumonas sp. TaxID=263765 RepID=UPI00292E06FC|nr:prepilin-type N-terminal cleavage/methylation domain-containing protein [uncultured Tolumonas sp.]
MKRSAGFTLIELIIVIVILGILAATAAPKFMNLQSDARKSTVSSLSGAVKSAASMAYSKAIIAGKDKVTASTSISISGATGGATTVLYGYPTADATGIATLIDISSSATGASADWGAAATTTAYILWPTGIATTAADALTAKCYVQYTPATSTTAAVTTNDTTGC